MSVYECVIPLVSCLSWGPPLGLIIVSLTDNSLCPHRRGLITAASTLAALPSNGLIRGDGLRACLLN